MPKYYTPQTFFRDVPGRLLQRYFSKRKLLADVEFENPKKSRKKIVAGIYKAWLALPHEIRSPIEQDFQEIHDMATEGGAQILLDEAAFHDENVANIFSKMESFHERAFWMFLEKRHYWDKANLLNHIELISERSWKKHHHFPQKPANLLPEAIKAFSIALAAYFHQTQGRGNHCEIISLRHGNIDYFIAYPEDYTQSSMEWEKQILTNRVHRPAFETIFAFNQEQGTLEIYCTKSSNAVIVDLQAIFAKRILNVELVDCDKPLQTFKYDLAMTLTRHFQFKYDPITSGITSVAINKVELFIPSAGRKLVLHANIKRDKNDIYTFLEQVHKAFPLQHVIVQKIGITVDRINPHKPTKIKKVSFDVTYPNACNLKHTEANLPIRQMLIDSGIEPTAVAAANDATPITEHEEIAQ